MTMLAKILLILFFTSNPVCSSAAPFKKNSISLKAMTKNIEFSIPKGFEKSIIQVPDGGGFWIYFKYPSMMPLSPSENQLPDAISLLVRPGNPSTPTISEITLQDLTIQAKNSLAQHVGTVNGLDTFSAVDASGCSFARRIDPLRLTLPPLPGERCHAVI